MGNRSWGLGFLLGFLWSHHRKDYVSTVLEVALIVLLVGKAKATLLAQAGPQARVTTHV